ncbi:hypothetical protein M6D81_17165 [Paenibacillus sp. J5C_2022]|nr:hypothetical protein [Paenibacillus sp. J5C2022]
MKIVKLIRKHSFQDVRVYQKQARSLAAMGYDVCLMAPRYNGNLLDINRRPVGGALYRGIRFQLDGVTFATFAAKRSVTDKEAAAWESRMLTELQGETPDSPLSWDGLLSGALLEEGDVYHAHEPWTLYEAVMAKRLLQRQGKRAKVIFDAHELEGDSPLLRRLMLETDHMITVSDSIGELYRQRYPHVTVSIIYNSPLYENEVAETAPAAASDEKAFTIGYEGMLTKEKGDPVRIMAIADRLAQEGINVRFKVLGKVVLPYGQGKVNMEKVLCDHPRIDYGWAPFQQLGKLWSGVDAGYIYFDLGVSNRIHALPNKLFSLMNSGVPIVVNAAQAMGDLINRYQCGIVIPKRNPSADDYAEQFALLYRDRELLHRLGRNAKEAMHSTYSWNRMEQRLRDIYHSL